MPATYTNAPKEIYTQLAQVMADYHGPLSEAGVKVKVLLAHPPVDEAGDATGPAITVGGYPAVAKTKILSLPARVAYGFDAEITLDSDQWDESSDEERVAILDHGLTHLEIGVDDEGAVKRDDAGRPKLRNKKHDRQFEFFDAVAHRHGEHSIEVRTVRGWLDGDDWKQCYLPFVNEAAEV